MSYRNVLLVLGCAPKKDGRPSDCMLSRIRKAVSLYRKDDYSHVIFSGGPTKLPIPESEVMRIVAMNHIPDGRILTERNSRDTVQNAVFCWELLKEKRPRRITIVTSAHHLPRARYIFTRLYSHMGVSLKFESAPDTFDPVAGVFYRLKETLLLAKIKVFGFG